VATLTDQIDALLPQTQCRRCGYPDCRAYANAIATGETDINRCPPGGEEAIRALAELIHQARKPLDPGVGTFTPGTVALIDEPLCIGCTKCIQACPVDAIVGAAKQMHTVIEALCTGCELCIPPCPVDCIHMQPATASTSGIDLPATDSGRADYFRARYRNRNSRLERYRLERQVRHPETRLGNAPELVERRKAEIAAAVERVRAKRSRQEPKKHES
jgi:electron transport complex protein RnfB